MVTVDVSIEDFGVEDRQKLEALFVEAGIEARLANRDEGYGQMGMGPPHAFWLVAIAAAPLYPFLIAFGKRMGERAGDDAYDGLKALVNRVWAIKVAPGEDGMAGRGKLSIHDAAGGRHIYLTGKTPTDEAWKSLRELDLRSLSPGVLSWSARNTEGIGEWQWRPKKEDDSSWSWSTHTPE